ncbi:MAG: EAL domain-containing protein [Natronospirillum sp.]|uniref:GGDEF domain-containing protein n=1 Tax=Natronospirillum sp. TaxID=2812955 RepID=UPI0025F76D95|nr:EAL domain-containing protein [Natronospirillum sp.]MCH8551146.1 EAL domain-containing protein [Natronospirillum sp.]
MITRKEVLPTTEDGRDGSLRQLRLDTRLDDHDAMTVRAIIECGIRSLYQPIIDLTQNDIIGYECLSRGPDGHVLEPPIDLFQEAHQLDLLPPLETACRRLAIERFNERNLTGQLFLNCAPDAFLHPGYPKGFTLDQLAQSGLKPDNVVIELTDTRFREDFSALQTACHHYRKMGFGVAIADFGTSYNGLRLWSELEPDYIKLDPHFTHNIQRSHIKQAFLRALVQLCEELRSKLIVTGVESVEEVDMLQELGVYLMQGFYYGHPAEKPVRPSTLAIDAPPRRRAEDFQQARGFARWVEPIGPDTLLEQLWQRLEADPQAPVIPVVNQGMPLGLIERTTVYELLARPSGRTLHARSPVHQHMSPRALIVSHTTLLTDLSRMVTAQNDLQVRQHFIVTGQNGQYMGVGRSSDLLRHISEHRLRTARHANPLTHLPGNVPTNEHLLELIRQQGAFSVAYVDIDAFKPFNDTWGYHMGDRVIMLLARLLRERLRDRKFFIGHIGGDDFVVVSTARNPEPQLRLLQLLFAEGVRELMMTAGKNATSYPAVDRHGVQRQFALPRVSIGVVTVREQQVTSLDSLSPALSSAKSAAKKLGGQGIYSMKWQPGAD